MSATLFTHKMSLCELTETTSRHVCQLGIMKKQTNDEDAFRANLGLAFFT